MQSTGKVKKVGNCPLYDPTMPSNEVNNTKYHWYSASQSKSPKPATVTSSTHAKACSIDERSAEVKINSESAGVSTKPPSSRLSPSHSKRDESMMDTTPSNSSSSSRTGKPSRLKRVKPEPPSDVLTTAVRPKIKETMVSDACLLVLHLLHYGSYIYRCS